VLVVLGYHETREDGSHGISDICRAGVRLAERLADERDVRAVIFTGWSACGGPSEAEQMAALWHGRRDLDLIREPLACNTAENAARTLPLVAALDDVREVVVVCSIRHVPRVRFLFDRLYRRHGYPVGYRYVTSPRPSAALVLSELSSITRMWRDRRAAWRAVASGSLLAGLHPSVVVDGDPPARARHAAPQPEPARGPAGREHGLGVGL